VRACGVAYTGHAVDLADPSAAEAFAAEILASDARLRALVNNAGAGIGPATLEQTTVADLERIMRLNVVTPYLLIRALADRLARDGGRVVNIGSAVAIHRMPPDTTSVAYCAAKGALTGLGRQAGRLLAPTGVTVNTVHPGDVLTEAGRAWFDGLGDAERATVLARVPRGELTTSEEVAHAVVALCDPAAGAIVGTSLEVNSGAWIR
jgi:3-oxoacyl-[acyl-carrier protein] reductase